MLTLFWLAMDKHFVQAVPFVQVPPSTSVYYSWCIKTIKCPFSGLKQPLGTVYCILRGRIKGFNSSITTILFEVDSYRTVVGGSYRMLE